MSLHVECGLALLAGTNIQPIEIGGSLLWSETRATAGTTTNSAPSAPNSITAVVFTLHAEVDMWVSIRETPVATADPRRRMYAREVRSFIAPVGVRVAWSAT